MLDEYIKLFSGYDGDFGIADMSKAKLDSERNKLKARLRMGRKTITQVIIKITLMEKYQLVYNLVDLIKQHNLPCIDIDPKNYSEFKVKQYLEKFEQYKLPLIPLLSKSGGLHCYIFLKEPIPAADLIEAVKAFLLP